MTKITRVVTIGGGTGSYVSLMGLERSQRYAQDLLAQAHAALGASGLSNTAALAGLADMVVHRSH